MTSGRSRSSRRVFCSDPLAPVSTSSATRRSALLRLWAFRLLLAALLGGGAIWMSAYRAPEAYYRRALADIDGNRLESVAYELLGLPKNPRYEAQASLLSGALLVASGEVKAAPHVLALAAANPDTEVRASVLLGECLYKSERFGEAYAVWSKAVELDPDNVDAHRWLGVAYYDLGLIREALAHLQKAADLNPHDPGPLRLIGQIGIDYWQAQTAIDAYQEALRRDPDSPASDDVRVGLAKAFYQANRLREAVELLSQCAPTAGILAFRAQCERDLGSAERAWPFLEEALAQEPDHVRGLALKGQLLLEARRLEEAAQTLEKALRLAPKDTVMLYALSLVYTRSGKVQEAQELRQLGDRLTELHRMYEDLRLQAVDEPRDAQLRCRLGRLAAQLDRLTLARMWFQAALRLEPANPEAQAALQALGPET